MVLFQSMREMLGQQRQLARELNENFDKRIAQMRTMVHDQMRQLELLRIAESDLRERLDDMERSVSTLDQPLLQIDPAHLEQPQMKSTPDPSRPSNADAAPDSEVLLTSAFNAVADPHEASMLQEASAWVGLDLGENQKDLGDINVPANEPEEPADANAARQAFRALLNLGDDAESAPTPTAASAPVDKSNGAAANAAIHSRVCEYSDAGMSVAQIAQELGIGRGEVRLILSLRKGGGG